MKFTTAQSALGALLFVAGTEAAPKPVVDESYPYTGPAIPV